MKKDDDFPKLARPAQRALANAGIKNLADLRKMTKTELKQMHGIGPIAFKQLSEALQSSGISFKK